MANVKRAVGELNKSFVGQIWGVLLLLLIAVIGAALFAAFWGIWSIFAPIPKFWGFSRFWVDVISGAVYLPSLIMLVSIVFDGYDELSHHGNCPVSLSDLFTDEPCPGWLGLFLLIDFVASIYWSPAVGIAGIIFLAIIIGAYGLLKGPITALVQRIIEGVLAISGFNIKIT